MSTMTIKHSRILAASLAALLLAGCGGGDGDDDPDPAGPGTNSSFAATLTGALSGSFSGQSVYGSDNLGNFAIGLTGGTQTQPITIVFVRYAGGVPGAQQYDLADAMAGGDPNDGKFRAMVSVGSGASAQLLAGQSGRVTISSTSGNRLKGSFQFTAMTVGASPAPVTVSGNFDAITGTVAIP